MTNTNETIADIIAEWKREKITTEKSSAVGDSAKLREALVSALPIMRHCPFTSYNDAEINSVVAMMERALDAPPRNCDVGTADEQMERFVDFSCLTSHREVVRCAMNWAQMPYEEGGSK